MASGQMPAPYPAASGSLWTERVVVRAGQRGKCHQVLDLGLRQGRRLDVLVEPRVTYSVPLVVVV
jgi:hypothetical protein